MAEADVLVNFKSGSDELTAALQRQKQEATGLQQKLDEVKASVGGAVTAANDPLSAMLQRQQKEADALKVKLEGIRAAAGPAGAAALEPAHEKLTAELEQKHQRQVQQFARAQATGIIPPELVQKVGAPQPTLANRLAQAGGGILDTAGAVGQAAQGGTAGVMSLAGAIGQLAPGAGVVGGAIAAGAALGTALEAVRQSFLRIHPTLQETTGTLDRMMTVLQQGRQTGATTADQFRQAFEGREDVIARVAGRQAAGDTAGARAILEEENARARQDAARFEGRNTEVISGNVAGFLREQMERYRAANPLERAGIRGNFTEGFAGSNFLRNMWAAAGNNPEEMPGEFRNLDIANMNPSEIVRIARSFSSGAVRAQARVEATENALQPGGMPNLRPGGVDISQLPSLFQSRQSDVLSIRDQVQQEAVRDQRQEAQFQAQMRQWERIEAAILAQAGPVEAEWVPGGGGEF